MAGLRQRSVDRDGQSYADDVGSAGRELNCGDGGGDQIAGLVRTIEGEIIPRLMLAHVGGGVLPASASPHHRVPMDEDVAELARLVVSHDAPVALSYVEAMRARGMSVETIYVGLLGPAARRLGDLWEEDLCDFTEVTVGLWRLQQVLRVLSPTFQNEVEHRDASLRAILVPLPGEHHMFGVMVVAEFFRRAGWDVWDEPCVSVKELAETVRGAWFDIAGISVSSAVSSENRLESVAAAVRAIRRASRNPDVGVMVGGRIFSEHPDYVGLVGADATAANERMAVPQAQKLLALLARPAGPA
jgi:methanogenic corrinoid protein MtbC1